MRVRGLLLVAALIAALAVWMPVASPSAHATASAPTPIVVGNHLVDSRTGNTFVPHGANYSSFEYACAQGWGYSGDDATDASAAAMASWGINIVRVPLNEECWSNLDPTADYGTQAGYQAAVEAWVNTLNAHGIAVILDLHWNAPAGQRALGQWPMADSRSPAFWTSVATTFKNNPAVMFDLFNEPYSIWTGDTETFQLTWDCWENGGCKAPYVDESQQAIVGKGAGTYTVTGMSTLVTAVRNTGAKQPILLAGLDYANTLEGWLDHEPNDPDHQLVISWHNYDGQNQNCNSTACWNTSILPIAASVPILTTEFGETDGKTAWFTAFMTWADANGIGYLPWDWQNSTETSGDDSIYALYTGSNFTPSKPMGVAYHSYLASLPVAPAPPPRGSGHYVSLTQPSASMNPDLLPKRGLLHAPPSSRSNAAAAPMASVVIATSPVVASKHAPVDVLIFLRPWYLTSDQVRT